MIYCFKSLWFRLVAYIALTFGYHFVCRPSKNNLKYSANIKRHNDVMSDGKHGTITPCNHITTSTATIIEHLFANGVFISLTVIRICEMFPFHFLFATRYCARSSQCRQHVQAVNHIDFAHIHIYPFLPLFVCVYVCLGMRERERSVSARSAALRLLSLTLLFSLRQAHSLVIYTNFRTNTFLRSWSSLYHKLPSCHQCS